MNRSETSSTSDERPGSGRTSEESPASHGPRSHALIVGGGVIGLAIGWRLARRGLSVRVLERGRCGREASWAAAGMLAADAEMEYEEPEKQMDVIQAFNAG